MTRISLTVDDELCHDDVEPRLLLVDWLVGLGRPGPGQVCADATCGSCTVHLDGRSVKSCNLLAVQAAGAEVTTLAGISADGEPRPGQAAVNAAGAGACPGVVMAVAHLLSEHPTPSQEQVRSGLAGHQCGCVSEEDLVDAVLAAARQPGLASVEGGTS